MLFGVRYTLLNCLKVYLLKFFKYNFFSKYFKPLKDTCRVFLTFFLNISTSY